MARPRREFPRFPSWSGPQRFCSGRDCRLSPSALPASPSFVSTGAVPSWLHAKELHAVCSYFTQVQYFAHYFYIFFSSTRHCPFFPVQDVIMAETLALRGVLKGHEGWVTSIATPLDNSDILLSSSRDKSVILWTLTREDTGPDGNYGYPRRSLRGHSHFVQDVVISSDGQARAVLARSRFGGTPAGVRMPCAFAVLRQLCSRAEPRRMAAVGVLSRAAASGRSCAR